MEDIHSPRSKILSAALRLFNADGVHTTGIDRIIEESGVAKKTFYRYFPSKNALIAEYFRQKDLVWFERLERYSRNPALAPLERVLALFDALKEWFAESDFAGCPFIRGLSDFGADQSAPELVACVNEHFSRTGALVEDLLLEFSPLNYKQYIPQIMSLISGATILAHATGNPGTADINKEMARRLLS